MSCIPIHPLEAAPRPSPTVLPSTVAASAPDPVALVGPGRGTWRTLAGIGIIGGVLSGLFAIGGGILMVPLLVSRAHLDQRQATATSLVAIIPTAMVSSAAYLAHGEIDLVAGALLTLGAIVGARVGSHLLQRISLSWLRWLFIAFILAVAARLLLLAPGRSEVVAMSAVTALGHVGLGLIMGIASGLFGIGGGIIAVPLLVSMFAVSDLAAKGTALLVSIPTSAVGSAANRRSGLVDVRAGLVVGAAAALASLPAVYLALAIPAELSRRLFVALLLAVAIRLTVKARRAERNEQAGRR